MPAVGPLPSNPIPPDSTIADNAVALGTPNLRIIAGEAPAALKDLPPPDALFIGGGLTRNLLATCWQALPAGGRLVANAVTVESEQTLCNGTVSGGRSHPRDSTRRTYRQVSRVESRHRSHNGP